LKILESINFYRAELCTPPLNDSKDDPERLAWILGSHLLKTLDVPGLTVFDTLLKAADKRSFDRVEHQDVINAVPYSKTGKTILSASEIKDMVPVAINSWLRNTEKLGI
jgi:hypothetical protein